METKIYEDYRDYGDIYRLKRIIRSYSFYRESAERGNIDLLCTAVDIDNGLNNGGLLEEERDCIVQCLIKGFSYAEQGESRGRTKKWVNERIWRGLVKISYYLSTGKTLKTWEAKKRLKEMREYKKEVNRRMDEMVEQAKNNQILETKE